MVTERGLGARLGIAVVIWLATADFPAHAQGTDDLVTLRTQVEQLRSQGKSSEAQPAAERYVTLARQRFGEQHPEYGTAVAWLATIYQDLGRYAEAEPLFKAALAGREKALGPTHPGVGTSLSNLALLYRDMGRYVEAEQLLIRALAIAEKALGHDHPDVGIRLNNLAGMYRAQGRYADAEPLFKRALAIAEKSLNPDHPSVAIRLNNLAELYLAQGRHVEAEPLYNRALSISEKALGADHPSVGTRLNNLAALYRAQGRYAEAEPLYKRSLAIVEKALGPDHPDAGARLNNLAALYEAQGRYAEAESHYKRDLAISEKVLGADHPDVGINLNNLAALQFAQRDWIGAVDYWRRSTALIARRVQRSSADARQAFTAKRKSEAEQVSFRFSGLVKAMHQLTVRDQRLIAGGLDETFVAAQWALSSEAAGSLAQMAVRSTRGDQQLAALVRERQDLLEEWQKRDAMRITAVSQPSDKRDMVAELANGTRLVAIDARIGEIDKRLVAEFPDYAALARPVPLAIEEVQAQLRADEALVLLLDTPEWKPTPEETFIWVVTKGEARWVRSDLGSRAVTREVAALRCGLDEEAWADDRAATCTKLGATSDGSLRFDQARAHALYKALFGEIDELIRDKQLLIVPSGSLTQLPFQVLLTAPPHGDDYRSAAWLIRRNAITVLPAVSSLKALRRVARPSAATKPMVGFGNPLLDGNPAARPWEAEWAKLARQKQVCPRAPPQRVAVLSKRRGLARMAMRGMHADLEHLRSQAPLHDTADELCTVADGLKVSPDDILLGARATETTIKSMSDKGMLANYRVIHFATHGTLAGELEGTSEPGLILTPPAQQSDLDDGFLSASEVAALKVDADWVILSACNTAAGNSDKAESLSGLARAFFYAGARALLVSHWAVNSEATVNLITSAVGAISRDNKIGRAEALRWAMLAMIDKGKSHEAYPAYWAPFVVVGEGASLR